MIGNIKEYEEDSVIQNYLVTGEKRNEHGTKTKLDFYKRCILERQIITDLHAGKSVIAFKFLMK